MRDIVYLLRPDVEGHDRELRYSLRSLSNLPHGTVWMFGGKPKWVKNVEHIPFKTTGDKWTDIAEKFKAFPTLDQMPNELLHFDDDMYIMKPMDSVPFYATGTMDFVYSLAAYQPRNTYFPYVKRTIRFLKERGFDTPYMASIHTPLAFERDAMPVHEDDGNGPYDWRSIYYNYALRNGKKLVMMMGDAKAKTEQDLFNIMMRGQGFLSSQEETFSLIKMDNLLSRTFPKPCEYEASW